MTNDTNKPTRYQVERCRDKEQAIYDVLDMYEVLDMERIATQRVVCRTSFADANMIAGALEKNQ